MTSAAPFSMSVLTTRFPQKEAACVLTILVLPVLQVKSNPAVAARPLEITMLVAVLMLDEFFDDNYVIITW